MGGGEHDKKKTAVCLHSEQMTWLWLHFTINPKARRGVLVQKSCWLIGLYLIFPNFQIN